MAIRRPLVSRRTDRATVWRNAGRSRPEQAGEPLCTGRSCGRRRPSVLGEFHGDLRFQCPAALCRCAALPWAPGSRLDRAQANYLLNVLRLKAADSVLIFNGRDGEWRAEIAVEGRKAADLVCVERTRPQTAPRRTSSTPSPRSSMPASTTWCRRPWRWAPAILQPIRTRRTQSTRVNLDRMRANSIEAAEQCGILTLPEIREELNFANMIKGLESDRLVVFCDEEAPISNPLAALKDRRRKWREPGSRMRRYRWPRRGLYRRGESTCCRPREMCSRIVGTPHPSRRHRRRRRARTGADACLGDWT